MYVWREIQYLGENKITDLWLEDTETNRRYLEVSRINANRHNHPAFKLVIQRYKLESSKETTPISPLPLDEVVGPTT